MSLIVWKSIKSVLQGWQGPFCLDFYLRSEDSLVTSNSFLFFLCIDTYSQPITVVFWLYCDFVWNMGLQISRPTHCNYP